MDFNTKSQCPSLIHERLGTVMSGPRDLFKRRVNEKGRVSRRQSGASNRISGLESDTPSTKPRFVLYGWGRRWSRLRVPSLSGRLRRTATMDNKGERDRAATKSRSIRLAWKYIMLAGNGRELPKGRTPRLVVHGRDAAEHNYHDRPSVPVYFYCCYFTSPRTKEMLHDVIFVNPLGPQHTLTFMKIYS